MTVTVVLVLVLSMVAKLITAPPNIVVVWLASKFAIHQKFKPEEVVDITYGGKSLDAEKKAAFLESYNEANFLVQNSIFKGNEKYYLNPELDVTPYIMNVKKGKKGNTDIKLTIYYDEERIEVIKQVKKHVVSYSINSESLEKMVNPSYVPA